MSRLSPGGPRGRTWGQDCGEDGGSLAEVEGTVAVAMEELVGVADEGAEESAPEGRPGAPLGVAGRDEVRLKDEAEDSRSVRVPANPSPDPP